MTEQKPFTWIPFNQFHQVQAGTTVAIFYPGDEANEEQVVVATITKKGPLFKHYLPIPFDVLDCTHVMIVDHPELDY